MTAAIATYRQSQRFSRSAELAAVRIEPLIDAFMESSFARRYAKPP
jgi:hypothetical protein